MLAGIPTTTRRNSNSPAGSCSPQNAVRMNLAGGKYSQMYLHQLFSRVPHPFYGVVGINDGQRILLKRRAGGPDSQHTTQSTVCNPEKVRDDVGMILQSPVGHNLNHTFHLRYASSDDAELPRRHGREDARHLPRASAEPL